VAYQKSSFGSSAISTKDPPLSVPFSRRVWHYRKAGTTYFSLSHEVTRSVSSFINKLSPKKYAFLIPLQAYEIVYFYQKVSNYYKSGFS
jgi:hypothetical protein